MDSAKHIHSLERTTIANVIEACVEEKRSGLMAPITRPFLRASSYTKKSQTTIRKIYNERKLQPEGLLKSPRKSGPPKKSPKCIYIDSCAQNVIRRTIEEFYYEMKVVPSLRKLLPAIRAKIGFPWGKHKLHQILKQMGFTWKKSCSKRAILCERDDIIDWRYRYLVRMKQVRSENRPIVFVDETWVDSNLEFRKCWQMEGVRAVENIENTYSSIRYIIVHIGSTDELLPGGKLVYNAEAISGDYQMNYKNFSRWAEEQILPNLPPNSVIVMDNASYSGEVNEPPCRSASKSAMVSWLISNEVEADESMRKSVLYEMISAKKQNTKIYRSDQLFESHGHTVVRLPPYNCDLNPIELAWAKLKGYVKKRYLNGDLNLSRLGAVVEQGLRTLTADDWTQYSRLVLHLERCYWEKDGVIEEVIDSFLNIVTEDDGEGESSDISDLDISETDDDMME